MTTAKIFASGKGSPMGRAELIVLLGALTAFGPLSIDMYLPALPTIARELHASMAGADRTMATYFIAFASGQLFYGPIADRFGRKVPLIIALSGFVFACIGGALASDIGALAAFRAAQGLSACAGAVIARACVRDLFDGDEVVRVMARMFLVMGVSPLIAPTMGGLIILVAGWRAVFWTQGAIGLVLVAAVAFRLPETHRSTPRGLHPISLTRDFAAVLVDRRFIGFTLGSAIAGIGGYVYLVGSAHILITLYHVPPHVYGMIFSLNAAGYIAMAQLGAYLLRRQSGERVLMLSHVCLALVSLAFLGLSAAGGAGLLGVELGFFAYNTFLGSVTPMSNGLAMRAFGVNAGMASSLVGVMQFGFATLGALVAGWIAGPNIMPTAAIMAACATGGLLCNLLLMPRSARVT